MSNLSSVWRAGYMANVSTDNPYNWKRKPFHWFAWFNGYCSGDDRRWNEVKDWLERKAMP